jgi:hypothetical protein
MQQPARPAHRGNAASDVDLLKDFDHIIDLDA